MYIYRILNKINGKSYIGSTNNVERRFKEHIGAAHWTKSDSYNYPLQSAFRKYGIDNFNFLILEEVSIDKTPEREQYWIKYYNTLTNSGYGYNQTLETECALRDPELHQKQIDKIGKRCALINEQNNILEIYQSLNDAARKNGKSGGASSIKKVCEGELRTTFKGKIFRYLDESNNIIEPIIKTRKRKTAIRGVSIFDEQDVVEYESISEAAKKENISRSSLHKHLRGDSKYSKVKNRIWTKIEG